MDIEIGYIDRGPGQEYGVTSYNNSRSVSGNAKLTQRFYITMFNSGFVFNSEDGSTFTDGFGGGASNILSSNNATYDSNSLNASILLVIRRTEDSILMEQEGKDIPPTETLVEAVLTSVNIEGDSISIEVKITPEELDGGNTIIQTPITQG